MSARLLLWVTNALIAVAFLTIAPSSVIAQTARPKPSPTPIHKGASSLPPEVLTSVSQILDVKPNDVHFEALRSLIERYGIGGLTRDKRFNGNANLSGSDFGTIDRSVHQMMAIYLSTIDLPAAEISKWFPQNCPIDMKKQLFTEKMIGEYLDCSFGPGSVEDLNPTTATLSRSRFVLMLDAALSNANIRLSTLEAKALKAREDAKKTPTPTSKPAPTPKKPN